MLSSKEPAPEVQCAEAIESLLTCYEGILTHSRNFSSAADAAGRASLEWHVAKLTQASESLLQAMGSIKVAMVANRVPAANARLEQRNKELRNADVARQHALVSLGEEVSRLLHELEEDYYATDVP